MGGGHHAQSRGHGAGRTSITDETKRGRPIRTDGPLCPLRTNGADIGHSAREDSLEPRRNRGFETRISHLVRCNISENRVSGWALALAALSFAFMALRVLFSEQFQQRSSSSRSHDNIPETPKDLSKRDRHECCLLIFGKATCCGDVDGAAE